MESQETAQQSKKGLSTFSGVYLPSVLTIFGVIMYLRLGYVIGCVRLFPALVIIIISSSITLLTSLSIATSATNIKVQGGGAYFLISRAFGKELGAAIGLPLFLAQAIGIAFYIAGFVESTAAFLPGVPYALIGIVTLIAITALACWSTSIVVKTQLFIFIAVLLSLVSFFSGTSVTVPEFSQTATKLSFWGTFALFFPAVTGIEAGVAMSGDLKNPSRSLVIGTLGAVGTGLIVYLAMAWVLWMRVPRHQLLTDPYVVEHVARWGWMITLGIWGATLSSAIGGMMGAPRTLQALAKDGVLPAWLGQGYGESEEPRMATLFTFAISSLCIVLGRIDIIAPILTMFFLISYGMLNLASGLESLAQNPSWRPTFKIPTLVSLTGAALAVGAMFMIDSGSTFIAIFFVLVTYYYMARSKLSSSWDDIRQGILFLFSRFAIYRLALSAPTPRSWRPNFIVFTDGYSASENLLEFTSKITQGKGFLTVASVFSSARDKVNLDLAKSRISELFAKKKVEALVAVTEEADQFEGIENLIVNYGLGSIRPNTVVVGDALSKDSGSKIPHVILHSVEQKKNVIVIVGEPKDNFVESSSQEKQSKHIDVWWDDSNKKNSELMLVLAHMHQYAGAYGSIEINLKCTVRDEAGREMRRKFFEQFFTNSRLRVNTHVYVADDSDEIPRLIGRFSEKADIILHGLKLPKEGESIEEYTQYYKSLLRSHKQLQNVVYVACVEPIDMHAIFA